MTNSILYSARWVLPIAQAPIHNGALVVDGTTIQAVGCRQDVIDSLPNASAVETVDLGECAILPGLVNVHTHFELGLLRGACEETDFFPWIRHLTQLKYEVMQKEDFRLGARWAALEAIRSGITTVGDASDQGTVLDALLECGLRGIVYHEVFGPDSADSDTQIAALADTVTEALGRQTARVNVGVSPHAPYTVSGPLFQATLALAAERSLPVSIHIAESAAETEFLRHASGPFADYLRGRSIDVTAQHTSPVGYLDNLGVLSWQPLLVHAVQVSSEDLDAIRRHDVPVAHCPKSNAKLGHGVAPLCEMLQRGVRVGLGTDATVSNNAYDLLDEARFACLLQRSRVDRQGDLPTATDMLRLATLGGAEALGLESKIGSLEEGKAADFIAIDLSGSRHGPIGTDPAAAILFTASGADVVLTAVDGHVLYAGGRVRTLDETALTRQVEAARDRVAGA